MTNPYAAVIEQCETPRETEARLLRDVARRLEAADAAGDPVALADAVFRVRQLWTTFAVDLVHEGNALPDQLKANLLGIAGFIDRSCSEILAGDRRTVATIVEINRNIAAGLA
ncbi:flagellar biosynthesis regulator FlaF [Benzoatithermus flavus]|uniref:Flagellar biosynthesis regulator FlaF n=1 Tax=Benzoatithermus flavus TaxID=3108223 RepID=A0ABU8XYK2_9PROT